MRAARAIGGGRLEARVTFEPVRFITALFLPSHLSVEVAGPKRWYHDEGVNLGGDDGDHLVRERGAVPYSVAPMLFESWEMFARLVSPLGDCTRRTYDGASYSHEGSSGEAIATACWVNPHWPEGAMALQATRAYAELAMAAGLGHLVRLAGW